MNKTMTIALLGQPNSGKSTFYNTLTGSHQHVGNWPGKTVERNTGTFQYKGNTYQVTDLPGTYSLAANSEEEIVTTYQNVMELLPDGGISVYENSWVFAKLVEDDAVAEAIVEHSVSGETFSAIKKAVSGILNGASHTGNCKFQWIDGIWAAFSFTVMMCGFVFGTTFVFGFLEEIGYMARISYVFDGTMRRLGLYGKAVMPFLVSFGCNIAGATGARVLDTWGQRMAAISMSWVVPCGSTWAVVGLVSSIFFGPGAALVVFLLFAVSVLHLQLTARVFGKRFLKESAHGASAVPQGAVEEPVLPQHTEEAAVH